MRSTSYVPARPLGDSAVPALEMPRTVLRWGPLLSRYAGSIPIPFLYAWISRESGGRPCTYTYLHEAGIFQLMPPHNTNEGGTTEAALRSACIEGTSRAARDLTDAENEEQIRSGVRYVNHARAYARRHVDWPETSADFWRMVKMVHVAPARVKRYAPGSRSWAEFRRRAEAGGDTPKNWLDNAEWVGGYGAGGASGGSLVTVLALAGVLVAGSAWYFKRRNG